jgi:hypothetical protein
MCAAGVMPVLLALVLALVRTALLLPLLTAHMARVLLRASHRGCCSSAWGMHGLVLLALLLVSTGAAAGSSGGVRCSEWVQAHCCAVMAGKPEVCGAAGIEATVPVSGIVQQHCMIDGTAAAAAASKAAAAKAAAAAGVLGHVELLL